jgi:thymidylate synthase
MSDITTHVSPVAYKKIRTPDEQYKTLLRRIKETGNPAQSGMDEGSTEVLGAILEYDLENGFPLITERDLTKVSTPVAIATYESDETHRELAGMLRQSVGEILGFINGARTQQELEVYGCKFWRPWTMDEAKAKKRGLELGDLGPGSYGAAFHDFPTLEEGGFNQYGVMIEQMKARPELRTHIVTPFIPQYISRAPGRQQKVLVVPCHGLQHYNIDVKNGEMSLVHFQRSGDVPIGVPFNMVHYALLLIMVAQVTGYKPRKLVHVISNAHMYDQHAAMVEELLSRPAYPFPLLKVDPSVKRLEDFRTEHFSIEEYTAHPPIRMGGTAV